MLPKCIIALRFFVLLSGKNLVPESPLQAEEGASGDRDGGSRR